MKKSKQIVVVGDTVIDRYLFAHFDRLSPEIPGVAPRVYHKQSVLGGAGYLFRNLMGLYSPSYLITLVDDNALQLYGELMNGKQLSVPFDGNMFEVTLSNDNVFCTLFYHPDSCDIKNRIVDQDMKYFMRFDEQRQDIWEHQDKILIDKDIISILKRLDDIEAIVISDYGKGLIDAHLIDLLMAFAIEHDIYIMADPHITSVHLYDGFDIVKLNRIEALEMYKKRAGKEANQLDIDELASSLCKMYDIDHMIITLGSTGCLIAHLNDGRVEHLVLKDDMTLVADSCGAGDAFMAAFVAAFAQPALESISITERIERSATVANSCAFYIVRRKGTLYTIAQDRFLQAVYLVTHDE
jgi:D-beta-D-heptose 7-phosphate kinase/D-beta-D-heptose 1-phosphate adenosyltransferase